MTHSFSSCTILGAGALDLALFPSGSISSALGPPAMTANEKNSSG